MKKTNHKQLAEFIYINREFYYKVAYSYAHNREEADVILLASISKAFDSIKGLNNPLAMKSWFYNIVIDAAIDYLNNKKRFILVKPVEEITISKELEIIVKQIIEEIVERIRLRKIRLICFISMAAVLLITYIYTTYSF